MITVTESIGNLASKVEKQIDKVVATLTRVLMNKAIKIFVNNSLYLESVNRKRELELKEQSLLFRVMM